MIMFALKLTLCNLHTDFNLTMKYNSHNDLYALIMILCDFIMNVWPLKSCYVVLTMTLCVLTMTLYFLKMTVCLSQWFFVTLTMTCMLSQRLCVAFTIFFVCLHHNFVWLYNDFACPQNDYYVYSQHTVWESQCICVLLQLLCMPIMTLCAFTITYVDSDCMPSKWLCSIYSNSLCLFQWLIYT